MLLTCPSCNAKYLLNSADLKPNGRTVKCAKCGHDWFQDSDSINEEGLSSSVPSSSSEDFNEKEVNKDKESNENKVGTVLSKSNLPSTYIKENKPSTFNTMLLIFFIILLIVIFFSIDNLSLDIFVLLNFYVQEFFFNIKLIINDFAKIIHQILN